jgi:hypothetical protein
VTSLADRLGYGPDDRLVVVSCENLGWTHAANTAAYEALRSGTATTASLAVPCPWARQAASTYRGEDVGVHLILTAPLETYRWGPITQAPSLLDGDGGFPRTVADLWDHADLDEVRRECRAQIERAILWGFDVDHLDAHQGVLEARPEFFDVYLELAIDFRLPIRLGDPTAEARYGFPFRRLAAEEGIVSPDHVVHVSGADPAVTFDRALGELAPGVTEIVFAPSTDTPEARAADPDWPTGVAQHELLSASGTAAAITAAGARPIGYRELRTAQLAV